MLAHKLKAFLDSQYVLYETIPHARAYTAQETAATAHISGKELAKTVIIWADDKLAMAVLPASQHVDEDLLQEAIGAANVQIAHERDFKDLFPECEVGAMPPFGNLYGMEVFVAASLTEDEEIAFNAGSHTELLKLAYKDFARLVQPRVLAFATVG